ncbi:MAG: hypothetical protein ACO2Z9_08995 [Crocinitomicaceae bacterium]
MSGYRIILFLFLLNVFNTFGQQDSVIVKVLVVDDRYGDPIKNAIGVVVSSDTLFGTTNSKGFFTKRIAVPTAVNVKIAHSQFLSDEQTKKLTTRYAGDTIVINFKLEFIKSQNVDSIVVYAPGSPQVVFSSPKLHVEDYELFKNGEILLLTYQKRLKKGSELKMFNGDKITSSFQVPDRALDLVHDFRGNAHVVCENNVYGIHQLDGRVGLSTLDKSYFMTYLAPILDTNASKIYFSNFNKDYPAFEYFSFDRMDSVYKKIMKIEDELMMELYRSEYKWMDVRTKLWAKNKEIQTGIDAEIWVGANYFTQSIYYKEVYAPLFHRDDTIYVFDYYKDLLFTFDKDGEVIDSLGIYHHYNPRATGWKREVVQDSKTGEVYAVFDRAGYTYVGRIDLKTGEIPEQVRLEHRYIQKVSVSGNHVYYVYRPFESIQKKYLYRERLPYKFETKEYYD